MSSSREVDETETKETPEQPEAPEVPKGWRPESATVKAISAPRDSGTEGKWVDQGIQDTPVDQINVSDTYVKSEADFKKVSHAEMVEGFTKLEAVVRPQVEAGAGPDDFSKMDAEQGLDNEHGYRKIYDAFYGDDAIRLNKDGDTYSVVNGYHRLCVAQELGIKSVPARVVERRR